MAQTSTPTTPEPDHTVVSPLRAIPPMVGPCSPPGCFACRRRMMADRSEGLGRPLGKRFAGSLWPAVKTSLRHQDTGLRPALRLRGGADAPSSPARVILTQTRGVIGSAAACRLEFLESIRALLAGIQGRSGRSRPGGCRLLGASRPGGRGGSPGRRGPAVCRWVRGCRRGRRRACEGPRCLRR